ncbi:hypothetical protein V6Z11_A10G162400 [Gossypium hirsutum]
MFIPAGHMASAEDSKEPEWIERVRSEGAVPLLEPDNCTNGWACPPGDTFMVRGPEYLSNKVKIPGGKYLLKSLGFDWIRSSTKLPTKDNYSAVAYFVSTEPIQEGSLIDQFLKGDDAFRNSRLKLIANIVKGPWIVKKAVGEQAICIIGRALSCQYCISENFIEVDIDIGSSMVASAIVHLAFGYITSLTVDLAFLIESQTEAELPERLLGAIRFSELKIDSAQLIEPSSYGSSGNLQASLPTRLWKSLGQGFSHLLHPGAQESGSVSTPTTHVNGTAVHEESDRDVK